MQRILLIGAGGHAVVVADILLRARDAGDPVTPIGYLDDNPDLIGHELLGLPVLGTTEELSLHDHDAILIAIGDNPTRRRLYVQLSLLGERFSIAKHPSAVVAADVAIGPGTMISAGAVINPGSVIGSNVILNTGSTVDHHNQIADHVHIAPGVNLGGAVEVGEGALIGIGAVVMPQRRIGAGSVVGGGSLVHSDLPDHVVAFGNPARIIRRTTGN
jgi:sugar O-acyltransferase (sialic acid O-acetyltransferase NeuD family)